MRSNITAAIIDEITAEQLSETPARELMALQTEVDAAVTLWKTRLDKLQEGLDKKFGAEATKERHAGSRDTGTINLKDDGLSIKCELSKRVKWDQEVLATIRMRIAGSGQNPDIYMQPEYKIKEAAYSTWPPAERAEFDKARTVSTDKPKYTVFDPAAKAKT